MYPLCNVKNPSIPKGWVYTPDKKARTPLDIVVSLNFDRKAIYRPKDLPIHELWWRHVDYLKWACKHFDLFQSAIRELDIVKKAIEGLILSHPKDPPYYKDDEERRPYSTFLIKNL